MTDVTDAENAPTAGSAKKGLLIGLIAAFALGGGGFYATYSGLIGGSSNSDANKEAKVASPRMGKDIVFIPLEPLVISLGAGANNRYLRFGAQLEVSETYQDEVTHLTPRILDVLNGYLRAVEARDIENPAAMGRLRAQMLRRVQVVTGDNRVRNLLITEFVLN